MKSKKILLPLHGLAFSILSMAVLLTVLLWSYNTMQIFSIVCICSGMGVSILLIQKNEGSLFVLRNSLSPVFALVFGVLALKPIIGQMSPAVLIFGIGGAVAFWVSIYAFWEIGKKRQIIVALLNVAIISCLMVYRYYCVSPPYQDFFYFFLWAMASFSIFLSFLAMYLWLHEYKLLAVGLCLLIILELFGCFSNSVF